MSAPILVPRLQPQPTAYVVHAPEPSKGFLLMVNGKSRMWYVHEVIAQERAKFINKLVADTILDCATEAVQVAADWATEHSLTIHPEAVAVCESVGEAIRRKLQEKLGAAPGREWAERGRG